MLLVYLFLSILFQFLIYVSVTLADGNNIPKFGEEKISDEERLTISNDKLRNKAVLEKCSHVDPYLE